MNKFKIVFLFIISISGSLYGQNNPKFVFCEIGVTENYNFFKKEPSVYIDFGSKELTQTIGKILVDSNTQKLIAFKTPIDALNYMVKKGWDFVQAYPTVGVNTTVIHYVLKKPYDSFDDETKAILAK